VELFRKFESETGMRILEGYGLTESSCVASLNPPDGESRIGSIGMRIPWEEMRVLILDGDGRYQRDAEVDEPGVIALNGPNIFTGYLDPAHDAGVWLERPSSDGTQRWLNTGDLGRMDGDGYFWLTGRKKELIIRGGHNIDPKSIEEVLAGHPAVEMSAAVGRPDPHAGEVPVAYVQLRPGVTVEEAELLRFAGEHIAERSAAPKAVIIVPALPVTAVGKIFKPTLNMKEIESVVRTEAIAAGVELAELRVEQDPQIGLIARYRATGDAAALAAALGRYAFKSQSL
jgi:acyl-CoA synthetase (AMP-forming)/AMP-acid ligase II